MKRSIIVSGAGRGIGRAIALHLSRDFEVYGCARTIAELEETKSLSKGKINIRSLDVRDSSALENWFESIPNLWGFVSAAGIYGPIGSFVDNSWNEWKEAIEINLYGTLLPTRIFLNQLRQRKSTGGRIVFLSGGGATQPLPNFTSYCASKAAIVRFAETLAIELRDLNITVNAIAPGAVNTKLTEQLIAAGPQMAGALMYKKALEQKETGGADPLKAAALVRYLMDEKNANISGKLLSAIWDPWQSLNENSEILSKSDVYTLRRIVPEEKK